MPDIVIPNTLNFARARFRLIENVGVSRALYTGRTRTSELGGDRVGCSLEAAPSMSAQRAALKAFAIQAGRRNRVFLYDPGYRPRGSFPANEMLPNADFSRGVTGYGGTTGTDLTVADGVLRMTRSVPSSPSPLTYLSVPTLAQYVPYAVRCVIRRGRVSSGTVTSGPIAVADIGQSVSTGANFFTTGDGLKTAPIVTLEAGAIAQYPAWYNSTLIEPGEYVDVLYNSMSRCIYADSGANLLPFSDDLTQSAWTKFQCSATYGDLAPDGTNTAARIIEDSTTNSHLVFDQTTILSSAGEYAYSVALLAGTRTWAFVNLSNITTGDARCFVNLSTGAIGTVSVTGTGWTNPRVSVTILGQGWILVTLVARKTDAATSIAGSVGPALGDGVVTYLGNGSGFIYHWRSTLANSTLPIRLRRTIGATAPDTPQSGFGIHVKGLPANTNGLLLFGDWVEIITSQGSELKMLTADLNSNAAGHGFLQFAPALRGTVADNSPIIVHRPMGRFISTADAIEYQDEPGIITTSSFDFEEG